MERKLNFMFYRPPADDYFMNKMVAWYKPPYSHVEIGFEDGMASLVCDGERVTMQFRGYKNPNYDILTLGVSDKAYCAVCAFCRDTHTREVGFDRLGMFSTALPFRILSPSPLRTFCSRYITEALQSGGVVHVRGVDAARVTPSGLYALLSAKGGNIIDTVPGRCVRIGKG